MKLEKSNLSKFEMNAIQKQDNAYKESFATKQFSFSCEMCCSRNLRATGTCSQCPIKEAYIKALKEIQEGKRFKPESHDNSQKSYHRNKDGSISVTITIHY